jgi:hypothetical protein
MKKFNQYFLLFLAAIFATNLAHTQYLSEDFSTDPLQNGWNNDGQQTLHSINYNSINENVDCDHNIGNGNENEYLHRTLDRPILNNFSASVKVNVSTFNSPDNSTRARAYFYPMLLATENFQAPNDHPHREGTGGASQQSEMIALRLSEIGNGNVTLNFHYRDANGTPTFFSFNGLATLSLDSTYYLRLEQFCDDRYRVGFYTDSEMVFDDFTAENEQFFTLPNGAMSSIITDYYISNLTGIYNGTNVELTCDDILVEDLFFTCCTPNKIEGPTQVCVQELINFNEYSVEVGPLANNIRWSLTSASLSQSLVSNGNVDADGVTRQNYAFTEPGVYQVSVSWMCGCNTFTLNQQVLVSEQEEINITSQTIVDCVTDPSNNFQRMYTLNGGTTTLTCNWTLFDDNNSIVQTFTGNPFLTDLIPEGHYSIRLQISDPLGGCEYQDENFNISCLDGTNIIVFPNPADKLIDIQATGEGITFDKYIIANQLGLPVQTESFAKTTDRSADLTRIEKGVYTISVFNGNLLVGSTSLVRK